MDKKPSDSQRHIYDYAIDGNGNWSCEGNPVEDPQLFRLLSHSLFQQSGRYFVRCEGEVHPVRVADAPLWVRYVHVLEDSQGKAVSVEIELQDGRREPLAADSLTVAHNQALYCLATHRHIKARFSRTAYYELTRYLQQNSETEPFFFVIGGKHYDIGDDADCLQKRTAQPKAAERPAST